MGSNGYRLAGNREGIMSSISVTSEVAGIVSQIDADAGARVAKDDPIVTLEAMKMLIPVLAPAYGVVESLAVAVGDTIEEGQAIARLTP